MQPEPAELTALEQAIAALEGQRRILGDQVVTTALAPLVDKRDRLLAASVGEQRKLVTVLFADLVDSTPLARRLDAEDLQQVMSRYFAAVRSAVEAEGGVVEKFIGDAVMAVFGLYRSREDDAARAVRAGLAVVAAVETLSAQLQESHAAPIVVRVGIDTGEMVVTGLAERASGDFLVVGDTANRAARLQAAAEPGTVLLSEETCRQVRGVFGLRRIPGLHLKGIEGPVDAYVVASPDREGFWPETRGVEGVVTRTVGREAEFRVLRDAFAGVVAEGGRRVVTVLGEAGVGKSRLVHDVETWLARLPTEVWVLRGRGSPSTQGVANTLLRSVFGERLGIRSTDDPERVRRRWAQGWTQLHGGVEDTDGSPETVATWLGFPVGDAGREAVGTTDPEALRRRGSGLVLRLLDTLAERAPVVVLLEDLHWLDAASLDSLEALARAPDGGPLLVLATARPTLLEQRPSWGRTASVHSTLRLEPLDQDDARSLVAEILQRADDVPAALVELVVGTADGNPYYVEELVKWLVQEGVVDTSHDPWRVAARPLDSVRIPTTLRGLLQARLDSLEVVERGVLGGAAVVGRVFWDQAVARLATAIDAATRDTALERLAIREVVFRRPHSSFSGSAEFSFRHALMRDVAYEGVLRSVRRAHHALAAQWLEEAVERSQRPDEHAAAVAHHHQEAGNPPAAARWYLRAGEHAARTFALDDALQLFARALPLVPAGEQGLWADVLLAREVVLDRLGRRDEQRTTLDELSAATGLDPVRRAKVLLAHGRWLFFRGDYPAVPEVADEAARLAREAGRPDLESDGLMQGGRSRAYLNEHAAARELLGQALTTARSTDDHKRAGEVLRLLAVVATNLAETDEGLALLDEARAEHRHIQDSEGEAMVTGQRGALLMHMGRLEEARAATEDALAVFQVTGHRYREGVMLTNLARIAMDQGRVDDALEQGRRALQLTEDIDDTEGVVASLQSLGDSHRLVGDHATARRYLDRGLEESSRRALSYFTTHLLASIAVVDLAEGRVDDALAHATAAQEAAAADDVPPAQARADLVAGMAHRAAGDPVAVDLLRAAAQRHAELGLEYDRLECLGVLALALRDAGDLGAAMEAVEEVLPHLDSVAVGTVEPGRVLADVHLVLSDAGDPRAADVAERAAAHLRERAARIADDDLRTRFLTAPVNVRLATIARTD
ncbi:tetratricopeptide repeat protein [Blastococcus sp. CT_GayMR20]|uniref:ATP-binding protein n=1 Tax=Blastococcus sp. CT_GayMR20 TaxID=2559609 RepID=UPI0010738CB3|nr:adenylate/guanylate cyclase domain-containing protein [Blastococcus sp. CT_GayMR20]TFV82927.1 tetratricopeptide repeat protein [Blastococcus sp. CT_GayMR20]TFV82944.1 tetratricopeptide repeat protein [Blastococcus sp. CT_GayMR20]